MAKGLRSSVKKSNRSKLKSNVFGPVENERAERLSAKLLELASQPKPTKTEMDVDSAAGPEKTSKPELQEQMDVDGHQDTKSPLSKSQAKRKTGRIHKKRRNKPSVQVTFPSMERAKRKVAEKKRRMR